MLRLEILQTKKLNRSIGEARVAWRSVTEGTTSNKPCDRRISPMCESLTKTGALMFVPAYLSLLLAMAVPFAPGDALRFLLLSLCFMFLGAGVAFLVASDIVRGR